jgi:hypothetical protein
VLAQVRNGFLMSETRLLFPSLNTVMIMTDDTLFTLPFDLERAPVERTVRLI